MMPSPIIPIVVICLVEFSHLGNAASINVTIKDPPGYPVVVGSQVTLECESTPSGTFQEYDWYKDGQKVTTAKTYNFYTTKMSAGIYYCSFRGTESMSYRLSLYFGPTKISFINNPSAPTDPVQAGQVKTFRCETDESNPVATITWYQYYGGEWQHLQNTPTSSDRKGSYGGEIRISEWAVTATKAMNGRFVRCTFTYSVKGHKHIVNTVQAPDDLSAVADMTMSVKFPNTKVTISTKHVNSVSDGTEAKFTCQTDESNPVANITWATGAASGWQEFTSGVNSSEVNGKYNGKIRISLWTVTATKAMNGKKIKCTSTYPPTGRISETTIVFNVDWPATQINMVEKPNASVALGDTVKITCQTDNCSNCQTIFWYNKYGLKFTTGVTPTSHPTGLYNGFFYKSTLTFKATKQDAQAKYKCTLGYGQDTPKQEIVINVHWPVTELKMVQHPTTPVKAGRSVTIKCVTNDGNPLTAVAITWFKNRRSISSGVTSKSSPSSGGGNVYESELRFTAEVDDDQAKYECKINDQAALRKDVLITVHYKATWNPKYQKVLTVASVVTQPVIFTLYVMANPSPTDVTWFFGGKSTAEKGFVAAKVNATTYTLSKTAISDGDYGEYTAKVTNPVGVSTFTFELGPKGAPRTPCCLKLLNITQQTVTLSFKSGFSGGATQTFTVEKFSGAGISDAAKGIADPGLGKEVIVRIIDLEPGTTYRFRVMAVNIYGRSAFGSTLKVTTGGDTIKVTGAVIGGAVGGVVAFLIIIAVILAVVFILKKRRADGDDVNNQDPYDEITMTSTHRVAGTRARDPTRSQRMGNGQAADIPATEEYVDVGGSWQKPQTSGDGNYEALNPKNISPPAPAADYMTLTFERKEAKDQVSVTDKRKPKKAGKPAKPPKPGPSNQAYDDTRLPPTPDGGDEAEYATAQVDGSDNYAYVHN